MLGQLVDIYETGDDAEPDDIRLCWSVSAIRGKDEPFIKTSGVTTLPGFVSSGQIHLSSERITDELVNKIVLPTAHKFQELANRYALEIAAPTSLPKGARTESAFTLPDFDDIAADAEIITTEQK